MGPLGLLGLLGPLGVRHTRPALGVGGATHEPEPMAGRLTPTGTTGGSLPPALGVGGPTHEPLAKAGRR